MMQLIAEQKQVKKLVRETARAAPTTAPSQRESDVGPEPKQGLVDQFQLLEAGEGKTDILIAVHVEGEKCGVWTLGGSHWVKQCDVPKDLPEWRVCFCAVADGLLAMGGKISNQDSPACYHYSLSERRWRMLPDMITPKSDAQAMEISPMVVMVVECYHDTCEILDIRQGEWSPVKPLPIHFKNVRASATDGRAFIIGLYGNNFAPNYELLEYHPSSDTYTQVQIDIPRSGHTLFHDSAMAAVAGKLYLVGRINIEIDITAQCVTQLPKPKATYQECYATARGKNILLYGGRDEDHSWDAVEEYNTTTRKWNMTDIVLPVRFLFRQTFAASISI